MGCANHPTDEELREIEKNEDKNNSYLKGEPYQFHHIYPQGNYARAFFESRGISIHEWTAPINTAIHQSISPAWTAAWKEVIEHSTPEDTPEQVFQFGQELFRAFGLEDA